MTAGLWALLLLAAPQPHLSAVVVGVNQSFEKEQPTLRYADDDAARFYEILSHKVEHFELLTVLDKESQSLFSAAAAAARTPSAEQLSEAMKRARKSAERARAEGRRTELYFVYTGHGRVLGGEGQVKLHNGVFGRSELLSQVLSAQEFDRVHVIIDACNAYLLVNARGEEQGAITAKFDGAFERFVQGQTLDRFPNVGVVLSTNGAGATHEWSKYQGGVFSHEVRSALTGAADANEDGRVDYAELEAFLAAANLNVPVLKGRPKVFVRPPVIEHRAVLLSLPIDLPTLALPARLSGHYYLEDDRGVRYAELNKAKGYTVSLRLVPRASYQLRTAEGAQVAELAPPKGAFVLSLPLSLGPIEQVARGAGVLPPVFGEPFGPGFMGGFRASLSLRVETKPAPSSRVTMMKVFGGITAGLAAGAVGLSVWQGKEMRDSHAMFQGAHRVEDVARYRSAVQTHRGATIGVGVTAGALAITSLVLFLLDANDR